MFRSKNNEDKNISWVAAVTVVLFLIFLLLTASKTTNSIENFGDEFMTYTTPTSTTSITTMSSTSSKETTTTMSTTTYTSSSSSIINIKEETEYTKVEFNLNNTSSTTTTQTTTMTTTVQREQNDKIYIGSYTITGYVATGNLTASGVYPYVGGVAMNKQKMNDLGLSYGDQIHIEGFGTYTVFDCGCAYNTIDIFCNTISECYAITSYGIDAYIVR